MRGQRFGLRLVEAEWLGRRARVRRGETPPARSSMRTSPRRTSVCSVDEGRSRRRSSASGNSPPQAASSARIACCFSVSAGSRASGTSTAKRSVRRASRSAAAVSRAIHFLRTSAASTGSDAAVAVRSVETLTGSPSASRVENATLQVLIFGGELAAALRGCFAAIPLPIAVDACRQACRGPGR